MFESVNGRWDVVESMKTASVHVASKKGLMDAEEIADVCRATLFLSSVISRIGGCISSLAGHRHTCDAQIVGCDVGRICREGSLSWQTRASPHQTSRRASVPDGTTGRCKGRAELRRPLHNRPMGLRHKLYASGSG